MMRKPKRRIFVVALRVALAKWESKGRNRRKEKRKKRNVWENSKKK